MKTIVMAPTVEFLSKELDNEQFKIFTHLTSKGFKLEETVLGVQYLKKEEPFIDGTQLKLF